MTAPRRSRNAGQRGAGLVETMIGILIGMIVVLVIYNVFALAEGYKRTAVGAADAQTTGLFAQFVLNREISNAGNGLSGAGGNLATCTAADPNWPTPAGFFAVAGARAIRPVPVMILDGGGANQSDSLIVTYSTAPRVISPTLFVDKSMTAGGDRFYVQSPNGFRVNDRVLAVDMGGNCELTTITAVVPGDSVGNVTTGIVGLDHPATTSLYLPGSAANGARLFNLGEDPNAGGPGPFATRTLFDVVNGQLRTTDLFGAAPAVPIAQNVVLMKAQYGIDCASNGIVVWTTATATNICGDGLNYTPDDFMPVPPAASAWTGPALARIRAIRIGIVVRSDEPDLKDPALVGQSAVLFDCSTHDAACQGRTVLDNTVLTDNFRFRTYETIVPMINAIYNDGL